jgi:hypothetical protein
MINTGINIRNSKKPLIEVIRGAKISEVLPLLTTIANKKNLKLSRLSDFQRAVTILENCILHETWHTGWSNVNWDNYADVKVSILSVENIRINNKLLSDFLKIRSNNIINHERTQVVL